MVKIACLCVRHHKRVSPRGGFYQGEGLAVTPHLLITTGPLCEVGGGEGLRGNKN